MQAQWLPCPLMWHPGGWFKPRQGSNRQWGVWWDWHLPNPPTGSMTGTEGTQMLQTQGVHGVTLESSAGPHIPGNHPALGGWAVVCLGEHGGGRPGTCGRRAEPRRARLPVSEAFGFPPSPLRGWPSYSLTATVLPRRHSQSASPIAWPLGLKATRGPGTEPSLPTRQPRHPPPACCPGWSSLRIHTPLPRGPRRLSHQEGCATGKSSPPPYFRVRPRL